MSSVELLLTRIKTQLAVLKWIAATIIGLILPTLWLLLRIADKLGAL